MHTVPHLKVVLSLRMESSTSAVTLACLGFRVLSLKYSLPTCLARLSHLYTVCLVVSKSSAMRVAAKPFLTSLPSSSDVRRQSHTIHRQNRHAAIIEIRVTLEG